MNRFHYKLGFCTVCGARIYSNDKFVKSEEGFCCDDCLTDCFGVEA